MLLELAPQPGLELGSILSNRRAGRFERLHDPLSKRFAPGGLVNLEIKFLRHGHFRTIGHALVPP